MAIGTHSTRHQLALHSRSKADRRLSPPVADIRFGYIIKPMSKSILSVTALLASHSLIAGTAVFIASDDSDNLSFEKPFFERVLDGDTIVVEGKAIHIRNIDAPELGPWASCWAEAALAGAAKSQLETELQGSEWQLVDVKQDADGTLTGRVLDQEGYDIADNMRVYGYAAMTEGRWDWCGQDDPFPEPRQSGQAPLGPNLWWPSNHMYDPRAGD